MPKLPRTTSRKVLVTLCRLGFYIHHQTGSHVNLRHRSKNIHVVIPRHSKELSLKTLKSILAQAELTAEEFKEVL
jgi:predicted RNA binding protein YcfA (HicA-like mRNA interferase family)